MGSSGKCRSAGGFTGSGSCTQVVGSYWGGFHFFDPLGGSGQRWDWDPDCLPYAPGSLCRLAHQHDDVAEIRGLTLPKIR